MKKATSKRPTTTTTVKRKYGKTVVSLTMTALQFKRVAAQIRKGVPGLTKEQIHQCAHVSCEIAVNLVAEISALLTEKEIEKMLKPPVLKVPRNARELRKLQKLLTPQQRVEQTLGIPPVELPINTDDFYLNMKPARKVRKKIVPANDLKN